MDTKELKELPVEDLSAKEAELRKELFNLRFQKTLGQIANPMRVREVRRDIARLLMFIHKKKV